MLSRSAFKPRIEKSHRADEWKRCEPFLKWLRGRQCFLAIHAPHRHRCEGKVRAFTTMDALNNFEAEKSAKIAELETARPELHAKVAAAVSARKSELGGSEFADDDLTGAATNGTLADAIEDTPAEAKVAEIKAALEQADAETVEAIVADYKQHEGGFDEEQRKAVEIAISQARARVAEPVQ